MVAARPLVSTRATAICRQRGNTQSFRKRRSVPSRRRSEPEGLSADFDGLQDFRHPSPPAPAAAPCVGASPTYQVARNEATRQQPVVTAGDCRARCEAAASGARLGLGGVGVQQAVHVDDEVAHVRVVDAALGGRLPGLVGFGVVGEDADDVERLDVGEVDDCPGI